MAYGEILLTLYIYIYICDIYVVYLEGITAPYIHLMPLKISIRSAIICTFTLSPIIMEVDNYPK